MQQQSHGTPFRRLQGTMALEIRERVVNLRQRASASTTECTGAVIGKNAGGDKTFHIPTFYVDARGTPKDWNERTTCLFWGDKTKKSSRLFQTLWLTQIE